MATQWPITLEVKAEKLATIMRYYRPAPLLWSLHLTSCPLHWSPIAQHRFHSGHPHFTFPLIHKMFSLRELQVRALHFLQITFFWRFRICYLKQSRTDISCPFHWFILTLGICYPHYIHCIWLFWLLCAIHTSVYSLGIIWLFLLVCFFWLLDQCLTHTKWTINICADYFYLFNTKKKKKIPANAMQVIQMKSAGWTRVDQSRCILSGGSSDYLNENWDYIEAK